MTTTNLENTPRTGWNGLVAHWKNDLFAALSVSLVALPLALGIAIAGGAPPIAGLISVAIAGLVATFFRGSHVAINGPANSLIVVSLAAHEQLDDGSGHAYGYVMAAFIVAGAIQVFLGILRLGKLGNIVPSAVIHGMLAAIGFIILGTQIHTALGIEASAEKILGILAEVPEDIIHLNPFITLIAAISLAILIYYPSLNTTIKRIIPAPVWVLVISSALFFLFRFFLEDSPYYSYLSSEHLIQIPDNLTSGLIYPDFSKINEPVFWLMVLLMTVVFSLESLISARAVDKLDPFKRQTNLNRELIGIGAASIVSGMIGGLPVSTVIARSSVNINNAAKTRWSNFFQGVILSILVLGFAPLIQKIPLAALSAILIFTGYKLIAPKVFKDISKKGWEQVSISLVTLISTLVAGLVPGLFCGIIFTLFIQYNRSGIPIKLFLRYLKSPFVKLVQEQSNTYLFKLKGIVNFTNILPIQSKINSLAQNKNVIVDFSHARLVDHTVLEYLHEYADKYSQQGGSFHFTGLDTHKTSSPHPYALHILEPVKPAKIRLTRRQQELKRLADNNHWKYQPEIDWHISDLNKFLFFQTRPAEFIKNQLRGINEDLETHWLICDISLKNAFIAFEQYSLSAEIISLPFEIPAFSIEKEAFLDRVAMLADQKDIDLEEFQDFSRKFLLMGPDEKAIRKFFTYQLISFFEKSEIYHLESNGKALLIFRHLRLTSPKEIPKMVYYSERLISRLQKAALSTARR